MLWRSPPLCLGLLAIAASCGGDPSGPEPSYEIRITPDRPLYFLGDTARATVVQISPSGGAASVGGFTLRTLHPALLSVQSGGQLVFLASGEAMVEAVVGKRIVSRTVSIRGMVHRSPIDMSETWRAADSPHIVEGAIAVGGVASPVLTIEPGSTVRFRPRAVMTFSHIAPGRLVVPAGGPTVTFEGDSAGRGTWVGMLFYGARNELRNVVMRGCGGAPPLGAATPGCLFVQQGLSAPEMLLDGVSIVDPREFGLAMGNFTSFAPGSRNLSITGSDGEIARLSPEAAAALPRGGSFTGNAVNEVLITTGRFRTSGSWVAQGWTWRIGGGVIVEGPTSPELRIPAGEQVKVTSGAAITVGQFEPGRLRVGETSGPPLVFAHAGAPWYGIDFGDLAGPSSLIRTTLSRCGSAIQGATRPCVRMFGGLGNGIQVLVDSLTILDAPWSGIQLSARAQFAPGSRNLRVDRAGDVPLALSTFAIPSLPSGDYRGNAVDILEVTTQTVDTSATWRDPGIPYRARTGLLIQGPDDPVLTLDPGVRVQVGAGAFILVRGALRAIGTPAARVAFSSTTPGSPGSWVGIHLEASVDTRTRLEFVDIEDAGQGDPGLAGALRFHVDPGGVFRNSTVRRSASCGVVLYGASWTDDYTSAAFNNSFVDVAGPRRCGPFGAVQ